MTPEDLKVKISEDKEKEIAQWLSDQIKTAIDDGRKAQQRRIKWIKQYEEELPEKKSFPWEGCSNISVPVTPIAVETIHARERNAVLTYRPYIQVKPKKPGVDKESCEKLRRFLDHLSVELQMSDKCSQWFLEKDKMGLGILKVIWIYDQKKHKVGTVDLIQKTDNASLEVLSREDFFYPTNARDIQTCAWIAQKIRPTWPELKRKEKLGIYKNVDEVKGLYDRGESHEDETLKEKERHEGLDRTAPDRLKEYKGLYEVWFDYDIKEDGIPQALVAVVEINNIILLRLIHHPYQHGKRPFIPLRFMKRTNRIDGKGICEMSEHIQDATNTVFNQAIDNATLANCKCYKARKQIRRQLGKMMPGKVYWLDNPKEDLIEFQMGDVHQSNFVIHNLLRDYHERRTKVTDYTLGKESSLLRSRATATGTLALLQESGKHFDMLVQEDREAMEELAYQLIELYQQYDPDKIYRVIDGVTKEGEDVWLDIAMPQKMGNPRDEFSFYCVATSMAVNKEIEKQNNMLLLQQLVVIYEKIMSLMMMIYNPQVQFPDDIREFMMGLVRSYHAIGQETIRSFEKIDVSDYIPNLPEMIRMARTGEDQGLQNILNLIRGIREGGGFEGGGAYPGVTGLEEGARVPGLLGTPEGTTGI